MVLKKVAAELLTLPQLSGFFGSPDRKNTWPRLIFGLDGSARVMMMAAVRLRLGCPLLIIAPDQGRAERILEDMSAIFSEENVIGFPGRELLFGYSLLSSSTETERQRAFCLARMAAGQVGVVVTTVAATLGRVMPPERFNQFNLTVETGQEWELEELLRRLLEAGYERVEMVEQAGQVSLRGGILDVFGIGSASPFRLEFFGDQAESIRQFDVSSQRSTLKLDSLTITPAREMVVGERERKAAVSLLEQELALLKQGNAGSVAAVRKREKCAEILEKVREQSYFPGINQYLPYFYSEPASLLDYLPQDGLILLDDPQRCLQEAKQLASELREAQSTLFAQGELLSGQASLTCDFDALLKAVPRRVLSFSLFSQPALSGLPYRRSVAVAAKPVPRFYGQWEMFLSEVAGWRKAGYRTVILTSSRDKSTGIAGILSDRQIPAYYTLSEPDLAARSVVILHGLLESGFIFPEVGLAVLTEQDVLPQRKKKRRFREKEGIRVGDYHQLTTGDFVVHEQHGIGQYLGVRTLEVGGVSRDYLLIQYAGDDRLYIPVEQMDAVRKYIGVEGKKPKLYALGGGEWSRLKARVQASVRELARELLALYAARETVPGFPFPPDSHWQSGFEAAFPYEETPDQLQAADEVKRDMERPRAMDRLLCGDVGYGKTEVALRAAFKAVMAGKQVAFLVPTTILAQQHFRNFKERLQDFPVNVDVLSRFQSPAEQKAILQGLSRGTTDIVVGTHRLLSADVRFHDLGLLVVDEEQRFGVRHKEKIKMLKQNVDVLTMTATPIPRTLHMSLVGVRDMSVIETPPENRYPVQTYVLEYSDALVREAVQREVSRGGQVYFVHNRVQSIEKWAQKLRKLLPDIKIAVAHGQMAEERLEKVMLDFLEGEYDLLLSTTIVEAGLDIPNVNTIIIHDADKFGLSQLYQLRGRVGRSSRVAYCYLTYQKDKVLTEVAEKRLQAIKEFTELGSGFKIALRDLEIRGAGNILGPEQHGFMMSVGFDLYVKLLEEAISMYRGELREKKPVPRVEISVDAYLPSTYISDTRQKIVFYQKVASLESLEEADEIREELADRFGPLPPAAANLLNVAALKILAAEIGVAAVSEEKGQVLVRFSGEASPDGALLLQAARTHQGRLTSAAGKQLVLALRPAARDPGTRLEFLLELFNELKKLVRERKAQV